MKATEGSVCAGVDGSQVWEDLVVAMLSVGGFSVERVLELRDSLERGGLLNPRNLASWDEARVTRELTAAGYERGMLTGMYAERLTGAMRALAAGECLAASEALLATGNREQIAHLLLPQKGIGPKVLASFMRLRGKEKATGENGGR